MTDATENTVLAQLRYIRTAVERLEHGQNEIKTKLLSIRDYQAAAHNDSINQAEAIEDLKKRVAVIERHLEIAE